MNLRHAAALALVGWYLVAPDSSVIAGSKSRLSTYTNETHGVSFRYPSDWTLKEGEVKLSWGYLGQVENVLPHGTTVAAVIVPYKPEYTGDNFAPQFLSVSVDTTLSADECNRFVPAHKTWAEPDPLQSHPIVKVGAIQFTEAVEGSAGLGHSRSAEYYHVFRNRACYEFELGEVDSSEPRRKTTAEYPEMKAILGTVSFHPMTNAATRSKSN